MIEQLIENHLDHLLKETDRPYNSLFQAARYSILGSGKRLRPILAILTAEFLGCQKERALNAACALEMIHTYSLIHDDLPSMDNDDMRRGKLSLHKVYPEGHAILAGDFLLTYAFEVITNDSHLSDRQKVELISVLSQKSGAHGMIGGQVLDIASEGQQIDLAALKQIHQNKTGALIAASVEFGAIIADAPFEKRKLLREFGENIGLAFQIMDDILDADEGKVSYATLLGIEQSEKLVEKLTSEALNKLASCGENTTSLTSLAKALTRRTS
jgi:geranylgeranyl diphosphate synthase type II